MGTRADFYVGRDDKAEWIGSVAYDGYLGGIPQPILAAVDAEAFRSMTVGMIEARKDGTLPAQGWPWPWETSATTDYAYAFEDGKVWASRFGGAWWAATDPEPGDAEIEEGAPVRVGPPARHPDMSAKKAVTWGPRSGALFFRVPK